MRFFGVIAAIMVIVLLPASPAWAWDDADDFFETRIRPLLADNCLDCHGDDSPEGELRLTSRASILQGGSSGPAAVPGNAADSLLIRAVRRVGVLKMPPTEKLGDQDIANLETWIENGLAWPVAAPKPETTSEMVVTATDREHWSFKPIQDFDPPVVADTTWPRTVLDNFILAKLEAAQLQPAPTADRRMFLRRVYYDLIGLPPTWDELRSFEKDESPQAYETVVNRLLESPRYGERWGRHWLDVARYADTKDGVLMFGDDRLRPFAYTYRDYVIRSFNEDVPFDRFVEEQLAADLINPPVDTWKLSALGFLTLGKMFDGNVHDVIDDQIDTVTRGLMGLTVSCARCHDHKFDPLPTADYYSLYGVFANSETPRDLPLIAPISETPGGNEFEHQVLSKREVLRTFVDEQYEMLSETARQRVGDYLVHVSTALIDPMETAVFFLSLSPEDLRVPIISRWRRLLESRLHAEDPVFGPWFELQSRLKSEIAGSSATPSGPSITEEVLSIWRQRPAGTDAGMANPIVLNALEEAKIESVADIAKTYGELFKLACERTKNPVDAESTESINSQWQQLVDLMVGPSSPTFFPKSQTFRYMSRAQIDDHNAKVLEIDRLSAQSPNAPPRAMVVQDSEIIREPKIFVRGNASQHGRPVPRQFLSVLSTDERQPFGTGSGRLDLARAITSPTNPLTARVIVNRVWMFHFGEPLVATPSDFGRRGNPPTHPELLDYLASQLQRNGWSLKWLHRQIVLSSTYRQSSHVDENIANAAMQVDPENRLLWRMNRQRLDLEAMRDTILQHASQLDNRFGGRPQSPIPDATMQRRTVYNLVDRQSLPGMYRTFDFASPDLSNERRPRTMVPQQALFALNSPFMLTQSRRLAERFAGDQATADREARIDWLYQTVFLRLPTDDERSACIAYLESATNDDAKSKAWQRLAQILLASNEVMYVD
jgi:hypothetical protein